MYDYNFEKEQFMEEYYEMNKKSRSKAYSMWGWLGLFGGHQFKTLSENVIMVKFVEIISLSFIIEE